MWYQKCWTLFNYDIKKTNSFTLHNQRHADVRIPSVNSSSFDLVIC